jgi:hypothetical protein
MCGIGPVEALRDGCGPFRDQRQSGDVADICIPPPLIRERHWRTFYVEAAKATYYSVGDYSIPALINIPFASAVPRKWTKD